MREGLPSNYSCGILRGVRLLPRGSIRVFSPTTRSTERPAGQARTLCKILSNNYRVLQRRIQEKLGQTGLPNSFNTWLFWQAGIHLEPHTVDIITVASLVVVVLIAIYLKIYPNRHIKA